MPRRIFTYDAGRGWEIYNLVSSAGAIFQTVGLLFLIANLVLSLRRGERAGDDPWDAWTLEWATTSPPAEYNFETFASSTQPSTALGPQTSGRPGLEVRIDQLMMRRPQWTNEDAITIPLSPAEWRLPSRRKMAVACFDRHRNGDVHDLRRRVPVLPRQEFDGPYPNQVLETPILSTICLLGSSLTIVFAERASAAREPRQISILVDGHNLPGRHLSGATAIEWHRLITVHHLTISTNLFGTTFYSLLACTPSRSSGLDAAGLVLVLEPARSPEETASRTTSR